MSDNSVYDELGVPTVINASGTKTRIGGSLIREEALDAMRDAAGNFARLSDLQTRASDRIAEATGADAGYVTNGAAGSLLLAAAACIAGDDLAVMNRLPDTEGVPDKIVMPRTHRTGYDHAFRTAGATIVDVGTNDHYLGTGSRNVEPWEYRDAITDDTVAVAHVYKAYGAPPLGEVCEIAHDHDVPVIVDAAAELPPTENLAWFNEQGADLVAFSGGKAIRGPQSTGILAGRQDLVQSVATQHLDMHAADSVWDPPTDLLPLDKFDGVPRQGIGRPLKVGKEDVVGLLAALDAFLDDDHDAAHVEWTARAERIADALDPFNAVEVTIDDGDASVAPEVVVSLDEATAPISTQDLVLALRREDPRVFVAADNVHQAQLSINPMCLTDEDADYVVDRLSAHLSEEER